jgi:hypothetical protein
MPRATGHHMNVEVVVRFRHRQIEKVKAEMRKSILEKFDIGQQPS